MAELIPHQTAYQVGELILQGEEPPLALIARASTLIDAAEGCQGTTDCNTYLEEARRSLHVFAKVLRSVTITLKDER